MYECPYSNITDISETIFSKMLMYTIITFEMQMMYHVDDFI